TTLVTELSQVLTIPNGATTLSFTIDGLNLLQGLNLPPDAFEVAIVDPTSHAALLGTDGLSLSDGLLSFQHDGTVYFGSAVHIPGVSQTGSIIVAQGDLTITLSL